MIQEHSWAILCAITISVFLLSCCWLTDLHGQTWSLHGQASGWISSNTETTPVAQAGFRYLPELSIGRKIDSSFSADMDLSLNGYAFGNFAKDKGPMYEKDVKLYRAWVRLALNSVEIRIGVQKINFGSAVLLRPLMWFDRIDPRDPLQLTDGVTAVLLRYYFLDNTNIWLWGLYGNNETKGWETLPTKYSSGEFGGRFQFPVLDGEFGLSYHHRNTDLHAVDTLFRTSRETSAPENRYGIDGKWDIGIGVWFEATLVHTKTSLPLPAYLRQWTLGTDYTFDIGNGLYALSEFFRTENSIGIFDRAPGTSFSALSMNYPFGVLDRISGILYFDWTHEAWYRFVNWQRTYDNWILSFLGFWNPNAFQLYRTQAGGTLFAGTGIQLMVIFNH
jgi:hypothetical protein